MSHALLSPSASHRWIECPPSVRLTEFMEDKSSAYADEGTLAHSIAENKLKSYLGYTNDFIECEDTSMNEYTDDYVTFVAEQMSVLENPSAYVEQRVDCSKYVPECFGTCDALIVSDGIIHICDLNANSSAAPGIVDANCNPILERSEVYSGVYGRASISFYAFNSNGNKGIACGLNNLQKIRDGEPLGGRTRAEDDFATDDDDFLS